MQPDQNGLFTDPEISLKLTLISVQVRTACNRVYGPRLPRILVRIRRTDKYDVEIGREVREDGNSLDCILYEADTVARVVILVSTIPKEHHLDVATGDNHLFDLCKRRQVVRYGSWVHLVVRRHQIRSATLRVPELTLMADRVLKSHGKPPLAAAATVLHRYDPHLVIKTPNHLPLVRRQEACSADRDLLLWLGGERARDLLL